MTKEPKKSLVIRYREECEEAISKIRDYKDWEKEEAIVHEVMDAGRRLFAHDLDKMTIGYLLRLGGKLAGAYTSLGQFSTMARAERDVYEQKLDETEKALQLELLKGGEYKVTQAKAEVAKKVSELREFVIQKEAVKNQWENLMEACEKMVSFIQSAIKVKEGERFQNKLQGEA